MLICHPNTKAELVKVLNTHSAEDSVYIHTIRPWSEKVVEDSLVPEFRYKRTEVLPDNSFFQMVDTNNPSSWAIYFGLVKKERVVYSVNDKRIYFVDNIWHHI